MRTLTLAKSSTRSGLAWTSSKVNPKQPKICSGEVGNRVNLSICECLISGHNLSPASFGQEIRDFISRDINMGKDPLKVDVFIFCYGFEFMDYSNAHEVIHTSPVLQVLNGSTAICEDPNVDRVSYVEDGL
ncbi:UNVERIFIED_CONTAM: hypothetical protein NCL1_08610 [Trichonephila clavipes]